MRTGAITCRPRHASLKPGAQPARQWPVAFWPLSLLCLVLPGMISPW